MAIGLSLFIVAERDTRAKARASASPMLRIRIRIPQSRPTLHRTAASAANIPYILQIQIHILTPIQSPTQISLDHLGIPHAAVNAVDAADVIWVPIPNQILTQIPIQTQTGNLPCRFA